MALDVKVFIKPDTLSSIIAAVVAAVVFTAGSVVFTHMVVKCMEWNPYYTIAGLFTFWLLVCVFMVSNPRKRG